jgi:ABC-type multidrug transport system ATPase subunit
MEASIALKNVSKHYKKKWVLSNLNIGIEKGSIFAIVGRNGAGKTTLLRVMASFIKPDTGTLYINGIDVSKEPLTVKAAVDFLPDYDIHDPWLTGRQNLEKRAVLLNLDRSVFRARYQELAGHFGITGILNAAPITYSRGEKRRLDLVQTLLGDAPVLILDEPLISLDFQYRKVLLEHLLGLRGGKTIVIASHELTEIQTLADRWIVLDDGRVRFDGTIEKMVSLIDLPYLVNFEVKKVDERFVRALQVQPEVKSIKTFGKIIQVSTDTPQQFFTLLQHIQLDSVLGISGLSVSLEELLTQLTAQEVEQA